MKPIGEIDLGEYYVSPWEWDEENEAYMRYFRRYDEEVPSDEKMIECLRSAGLNPDDTIIKYSQMEEVDNLLKAYSKRLKKIKAFQ